MTSNEMWGGRFSQSPDAILQAINASIGFDYKLYRQDIAGSKAHASMLAEVGLITGDDLKAILDGLDQVLLEIEEGRFSFLTQREDIHMNVEGRLSDLIGAPAGRLHTARSRNDQVATDMRLYVRDAIDHLLGLLVRYQKNLAEKALEHAALIMPGFTHLQTAQPITFGHHLLAYVEMADRDRGRFVDAKARLNYCPLGSGALAGTSFPINRETTAKALGFTAPTRNSLDAVSDRDFVLEFLSAASLTAMHLSRFAEEIVIWCSADFGFVSLSDKFTTGSSMMPQKRNPDAAELVRAKAGRIYGALQTLLVVMKGLPMAYAKDMQEDKEPLFDAVATLELMILAMTGMVADMMPHKKALKAAAQRGFSTATDLADWLVQALNIPFREAHHITGRVVALAAQKNVRLDQLSLDDMLSIDARITQSVFTVLSVENSVNSRVSLGGTAPQNVKREAKRWLKLLEKQL